MNIFALDTNPETCAQFHVDTHIVKMPLETAQMLCTVTQQYGGEAKYKPTHANHPCTRWAAENSGNYGWLVQLGLALCAEYTHRYGKVHACEAVIRSVSVPLYGMRVAARGSFALAMPDQYQQVDTVASYRHYYREAKASLHKWKKRQPPQWI